MTSFILVPTFRRAHWKVIGWRVHGMPLRHRGGFIVVLGLTATRVVAAQETPETRPAPEQPAPPTQPPPITPASAAAEPEEEPLRCDAPNPNRTLGDHQFIFPQFVDSAIIATYIGLRARLASSSIPDLPTDFGTLNLHAVGFTEGLDVGVKIVDWLGLNGTAFGDSLVSTNIPGLVYEGATFSYGFDVGPIIRLFRIEETGTQLALRGRYRHLNGQVASLAQVFASGTSQVALTNLVTGGLGDAIKTPVHQNDIDGSLALAQGFGRLFGLQASVGLGWTTSSIDPYDLSTGTRFEQTREGVSYRLGVAAGLDLVAMKLPVALVAEYDLSRESSPTEVIGSADLSPTSTLFGAVYYSGRPDLQLGLGGGAILGMPNAVTRNGASGDPHAAFGQFVLRYVWSPVRHDPI